MARTLTGYASSVSEERREQQRNEEQEQQEEHEHGHRWAVPGKESFEDDETLTEEERGEPTRPPEYTEPAES
jgi:hypothetical protein